MNDYFINTIALTTLVILIVGPVGIVSQIGNQRNTKTTSPQESGITLGAKTGSYQGSLSSERKGEIREISFTTQWGKKVTYNQALKIKNTSNREKAYQLEILTGKNNGKTQPEVKIYFNEQQKNTAHLNPNETVYVTLQVSAPYPAREDPSRTTNTAKVVIWEN